MTERDFCYWLQGFMEIENPTNITSEQVAMIKEHLGLVFNKVTGTGNIINIPQIKYVPLDLPTSQPYDIHWEKYCCKTGENDVDLGHQTPKLPPLTVTEKDVGTCIIGSPFTSIASTTIKSNPDFYVNSSNEVFSDGKKVGTLLSDFKGMGSYEWQLPMGSC